ncbi:MAG: peptidoglycan DD-metalloendopeptidase family protein [Patescibacteria group bacterium]
MIIINVIRSHFRTILPLFKAFLKDLACRHTAGTLTAFPAALIVFAVIAGGYFNLLNIDSNQAGIGNETIYSANLKTVVFPASADASGPVSGAPDNFLGFMVLDGAAALDHSSPLSNVLPDRNGLLIYKIKQKDNISKIAASFGISLETVIAANPNLQPSSLKAGQEIIILPVSGVLHSVQEGDTIDSIAAFYNVRPQDIVNFNQDINKVLSAFGTKLIIPGAKASLSRVLLKSDLPNLANFFAIPTTGWNWGQLHDYNAVDIANGCGTPIYAAAEGLVVEESSDGWNSGFGHYLKLEHPNKVQTLYAHTSVNKAGAGDYVLQGDLIAYIGNTGNTHGPTGCHLHFEVRGAKNPFAKY